MLPRFLSLIRWKLWGSILMIIRSEVDLDTDTPCSQRTGMHSCRPALHSFLRELSNMYVGLAAKYRFGLFDCDPGSESYLDSSTVVSQVLLLRLTCLFNL